jgi:hypothetical protein
MFVSGSTCRTGFSRLRNQDARQTALKQRKNGKGFFHAPPPLRRFACPVAWQGQNPRQGPTMLLLMSCRRSAATARRDSNAGRRLLGRPCRREVCPRRPPPQTHLTSYPRCVWRALRLRLSAVWTEYATKLPSEGTACGAPSRSRISPPLPSRSPRLT